MQMKMSIYFQSNKNFIRINTTIIDNFTISFLFNLSFNFNFNLNYIRGQMDNPNEKFLL
jgi:hypothetical protein